MRHLMLLCVVGVLVGCANGDESKPDGATGGDLPINPDVAIDGPITPDFPANDMPQSPDTGTSDGTPADLSTTDGGNNSCGSATKLSWAGSTITVQVDTTNATDTMDLGGSGCTGDTTGGHDLFYSIQLPAGAYDIVLTSADDPALYVLSSCSTTACIAGSDNIGSGLIETVTVTPSSTTTYIIVVDAYDSSEAGPSTLTIGVSSGTDGGVDGPIPDGGPTAPDGGVPDGGVPDAAVPDAGVPDAGVPDGPSPDSSNVPYCPPAGTTFNNPPTGLGDLVGQACGYACWGSGTLYNQCATNSWQFCLPQSVFAPCQLKP